MSALLPGPLSPSQTAIRPTPHHKRETCRACGSKQLRVFLSLGPTPLANSFLGSEDEFDNEPSFPLDVYFCENCSLVQLLDVIDPEVLFRHYLYVTGTSDTIAAWAEANNLKFRGHTLVWHASVPNWPRPLRTKP